MIAAAIKQLASQKRQAALTPMRSLTASASISGAHRGGIISSFSRRISSNRSISKTLAERLLPRHLFLDPTQHAVRMPTRTKLVTEGSEKTVYPSVAPSLFPLTPHSRPSRAYSR